MYVDAAYCYRWTCVVCSLKPCKNSTSNRDAVLDVDSCGPKVCISLDRVQIPHAKGQFWRGKRYLNGKWLAERAESTILIQWNLSFGETPNQVRFSCRKLRWKVTKYDVRILWSTVSVYERFECHYHLLCMQSTASATIHSVYVSLCYGCQLTVTVTGRQRNRRHSWESGKCEHRQRSGASWAELSHCSEQTCLLLVLSCFLSVVPMCGFDSQKCSEEWLQLVNMVFDDFNEHCCVIYVSILIHCVTWHELCFVIAYF